MPTEVRAAPIRSHFWTPYVYTLLGLTAVGFVFCLVRFFEGLGAVTNLTNSYPWGIWKAANVAAVVALATSGFTTAALVHIFNRKRFEAVVRPALLVGLLGYTFGALSLFIDIGRYYNIWHPAWPTMWQGDSALFEVAICIMSYLTIMYIEFVPIVCEHFIGKVHLPGSLAVLNRPIDILLRWIQKAINPILSIFLVLGVVLSCMHHSSLGSLMLVARYKMHPLWYTPMLPALFLMSVFAVGFAVVICESLAVSWGYRRRYQMDILDPLSVYVLIFLGLYAIAKVSDLLIREAHVYMWDGSPESLFFLVEVIFGIFVPFGMLVSHRVRSSPRWLGVASGLVVFGVFINRINVFITAYRSPFATERYIPSFSEIAITVGLVALFLFLHRVALFVLPIPSESREHELYVYEETHPVVNVTTIGECGGAHASCLHGQDAQHGEA